MNRQKQRARTICKGQSAASSELEASFPCVSQAGVATGLKHIDCRRNRANAAAYCRPGEHKNNSLGFPVRQKTAAKHSLFFSRMNTEVFISLMRSPCTVILERQAKRCPSL